ncbi:MAG TPA: glycoside hydrolase family 97 catalytic domain-containing protein [Pilimelia sp.]|nr:glycoside hydrolase family 97 catalytic domain-containing protein [Pilimelia sp.]
MRPRLSRRTGLLLAAGLVALALSGPAGAAAPEETGTGPARWTMTAPGADARVSATVALNRGRLSLTVRHGGTAVVEPSALGIRTAEADFTTGLRYAGRSERVIREAYTTLTGKRRQHLAEARETTLRFVAQGRRMDLVLRVAADGVAYRYVLPAAGWVTVLGEASEFAVPPGAETFLLPWDNGRNDYESIHEHATVAAAQPVEYGYPALFRVEQSWLLITESDLDDRYGGSHLRFSHSGSAASHASRPGTRVNAADRRFTLTLPDPAEVSEGPLATPWRTMVVGSLATVTESDLVTDLAEPSRVADTSWIRPGAAAWSWWFDGGGTLNNLPRMQQYVDLAARNGWEYTVLDSGWSATTVPQVVAYGRPRSVDVWIWVRWQQIDAQSERDRLFAQYKAWGVVGLKIDFPESDGQDRMRWYEAVLTDAARYQLMINFHGCTIPRGWERTWPHMLTMESVRGGEGTRRTPGRVPYPASHYVTVPFTRNLAGPMDWTPVTFSGVRPTSDAHELALSVIYESGLQHWADSPETYAAYPLAERLLRVVPVAWDDTRLLSGQPGDHVVLARRSGDDWFVGAGTAGPARTVEVPLSFLPAGDWLADVYHDGEAGALTLTTRTVDRAGRLAQAVANDGGFAAHLCPARPGRTTCAG